MDAFPDENKWPILGRDSELDASLEFLAPKDARADSRLLLVAGKSGIGKSFFVKELLCRFSASAPECIALYIDVDESEFESAEFTKRLAVLASYPSVATRKNPEHVPTKASLAKYLRPLPWPLQVLRIAYLGVKELAKLIPYLGKEISALLPVELPLSRERQFAVAGRVWDFLTAEAQHRPVLLIIDNIQFLTESLAMEIDTGFTTADKGIRLVVVERRRDTAQRANPLRCFGDRRREVGLAPLSWTQVTELVHTILGTSEPLAAQLGDVLYRKSEGNPKQVWLQLRSLRLGTISPENAAGYDETILGLPRLDKLALQLVTLLMGGLRLDDIVGILECVVHPMPESEIRQAILDLSVIGLLVVNGPTKDRVRTEHELVRLAVRRTTTEQEALELRDQTIAALRERLERVPDDEYDRLVDRMMGLLSVEELRLRPDFLAYLIGLIDRQRSKENYHYLSSFYNSVCSAETLRLLPRHCVVAFLDAFQKTSQFDRGLAVIESVRGQSSISIRDLDLFSAKYLVQKFDYGDAEVLLKGVSPGADRDVVLFNILLNLERDEEAKRMLGGIERLEILEETHCVILRNSGHLYEPSTSRALVFRSLEGFQQLGLRFGVATALNNLGVVELWAGDHIQAERRLHAAKTQLEFLNSNEAYQPLTNLSVLHAVRGDIHGAARLLSQARATVSRRLLMDDVMLRSNELILSLAAKSICLNDAVPRMQELFSLSLQTKDLRFRRAMAWLYEQLTSATTGDGSVDGPSAFEERTKAESKCGIEVFFDVRVEDRRVRLLLHLSPHWRY
jgi:hypothetical protein